LATPDDGVNWQLPLDTGGWSDFVRCTPHISPWGQARNGEGRCAMSGRIGAMLVAAALVLAAALAGGAGWGP